MLLSSIEIQGFKSFADKTVLKFGKGITAVVGPNGSGKSNISDAVRWVLGEQSTKSLRGQSMEDVIFGGTETRRPHGFCEVTLNINNTDRSLNFDNDFVAITRRYYRSHESEYAINNVSVRLKDIHELFMDTGLGRDGYSMIGQGKIDNIISSKSNERRDIFEEAAGISKYRYRKLEAERKLSAAQENLLRLHDIVDELEARVGPLEEQSRKAEKFLKLADQKKELEIGLWLYTLNNSKEALRSQESKIMVCEGQYKEIEQLLSDFDLKTEQNTSLFAKLTSDIEGERLNISSVNEEIVKSNGVITVLNNDILHNEESIARLNDEKTSISTSDVDAKAEIEAKYAEVVEIEGKKAELEEKLHALEIELSQLLSDSDLSSLKIENEIRTLNTLTAMSSDARVKLVTAQTSIDEIEARSGTLTDLISARKCEIEKLNGEFSDTDNMLSSLSEGIESYNNSLKGYELRLDSKNQSVNTLKQELDTVNLDIEAKNRRIQILRDLQNNMEGFANSVKVVLSKSETGILRGICGPISSLISVESKYSLAIETALNNAIQNIVTETEADAKNAINFLKNNKLGRATFLPVATITAREFKEHGFENMLGYVGIASELVKCDSKYNEIIKYLLGACVVAEDIDCAVTIARKFGYRIKVVTLDGQVVSPGGSLTGGSVIKNSGILSRGNDIIAFEKEIEVLKTKADDLQLKLTESQNALSEVNADITALKADIMTANEDKIRTIAELKRIGDLRESVKLSLKELEAEQTLGQGKLEELKQITVNSAKEIAEIESQKTKLSEKIDKMSGDRDSLNATREILANNITEVKLSVIEAQKDIEALVLSAKAIENLAEDRANRIIAIDSEIAVLQFKCENLRAEISAVNDSIADAGVKITESEKQIAEFIERRNATEKYGVELRNSERENTLKREQISGELARLQERKDVMMREYDDVIRRLYDEYELTRSEAEKIGIEIENPTLAKKTLVEVKNKIRALGNVNVSAIEEFKEVSERYNFLSSQIEDVETSRAQLLKLINQLTSQMQEIFAEGFTKISQNFSKTFTELFGGGTASLSLSDPENILESGIDINVKLPGKNVPSLDGLSGGEKALIALSIYFAIMRVSAPPFCFLDEVDTALDDINVERFADYMKSNDFNTQFICVTHRRGTMEAADMLYGVTMQEKGITKLLELNVSELEKKLLENQVG